LRRVLTTSELYHVIYGRCIKGESQKELRTFILNKFGRNYDKAYVSRIIGRLIEGGYLLCFNPRSRVKSYVATKKPFLLVDVSLLSKMPSRKSQRLRGRCNIVQIQKSSFICDVRHGPKINVKWDEERFLKNGVVQYQFSYPFENIGSVTFVRTVGKKKDSLQIMLPRFLWEKANGDPYPFIRELADRAGVWLMHRFKMDCSGLRVCQRPDFASPLTDKKLIELAQRGTYTVNGFMIDSSSPDNIPEIESKDYFDLLELTETPRKLRELEEKLNNVVDVVDKLVDTMDRIDININNLSIKIDSLFQPSKPDSRNEEIGRGVL